jgi:isoquinoline 1-oxidoreductase alpha subunit
MAPINLTVNGERHTVNVSPDTPLLWVLRDTLGLTGTKYGCGIGLCRACTVHIDGSPVPACSIPVSSAADRQVTTIEGLNGDLGAVLKEAWIAEQVPQCGYCQPGQIMAAAALLANKPKPTDADIDEAMSPHLCRCGTYQRIRRAIHRAAQEV